MVVQRVLGWTLGRLPGDGRCAGCSSHLPTEDKSSGEKQRNRYHSACLGLGQDQLENCRSEMRPQSGFHYGDGMNRTESCRGGGCSADETAGLGRDKVEN